MSAKFGPGGNSDAFRAAGLKSTLQAPRFVRELGLEAYEYEAGNGITGSNDMFLAVGRKAKEHGIDMHVTMLTRGGMGLDWHMKQEQTRFNIRYGGYDAVVLQHTAHPMGDLNDMKKGAETIAAWCREAGSRIVLYQTWTHFL